MKKSSEEIENIKVTDIHGNNITNRFSFLNGWLLNNESIQQLFGFLNSKGFTELSTRRLTQDNLEHFFGQIRRGAGNADSVTATMFCALFQKRWGINYVNIVTKGNCENFSENEVFETMPSSSNCLKNNFEQCDFLPFESIQIDEVEVQSDNDAELDAQIYLKENAFTYVCGYLLKKLRDSHPCSLPLPQFDETYYDKYTFTYEKELKNNKLIKPPEEFMKYIDELNNEFFKYFDSYCHLDNLSKHLYERLKCINPYKCCTQMNVENFIYLFIRTRIYFVLKFFNREASVPNLRKKMLKVSHM